MPSFRSVLARTQLVVTAFVLGSGCSPDGDVVGAATDGESGSGEDGGSSVDSDPDSDGIDTSGEGLSGRYTIESVTLECGGDCSATDQLFGPVSYCDVGTHDTDYARVEQMASMLQMDLDRGRAEGTLSDDGSFVLSGRATEAGGTVELAANIEGRFTGRHEGFTATLVYTARGSYEGDRIDCVGTLELTGDWETDECSGEPSVCPDEYPICYGDACNAGVTGDPCSEEKDCAAGYVCWDSACRLPGEAGEECYDDTHCAEGFLCAGGHCSAGGIGDPCDYSGHCKSMICFQQVCSAGGVGDDCWSDMDCVLGNACVAEMCSAGKNGDACDYPENCDSGICYENVCSAGAVGDACGYDSDCKSEICFEELCSAGAAGDPCSWDDECSDGLLCLYYECG